MTHPDFSRLLSERLDPLDRQAADASGHAFPAAVLIGLVQREGGYSVLLTRRSDAMRRHAGQVALPGGRCDPGETVAETAIREAWEEIGLEPSFVTPLGQSNAATATSGIHITPVVGLIAPGFTLAANPAEVAVIFEAPFAFLMNPETFKEQEVDFGQGLRRFHAATHEDQLIWGATARIFISLRERLYD
ncbi:NUDIX hydrolase [Phenylobacterium immobile]|uniref:NUDIX hydrolase n=1 Tax=Phenylobacterium immobile TaxID=21 RepID=UPI000A469756|nr:CoA pyrophosphatase [Phenylobacterium immobile]